MYPYPPSPGTEEKPKTDIPQIQIFGATVRAETNGVSCEVDPDIPCAWDWRFGPQPDCEIQCHSACALSFALGIRHPASFIWGRYKMTPTHYYHGIAIVRRM